MIGLFVAAVLIVGDSISLGSSAYIAEAIPAPVKVDAVIGRQFNSAPAIIRGWTRQNDGPVVVELGANGPIREKDLDAVVQATNGRLLVLVGCSVPRSYKALNNWLLRSKAGPNIKFVDWEKIVRENEGVLGPDQIHPTQHGRKLLAAAIAGAVTGQ